MRFDFFRVAVLVAIAQCGTENGRSQRQRSEPNNANKDCDTPDRTRDRIERALGRSAYDLSLSLEDVSEKTDLFNRSDKNLTLTNATCANERASCARRSCPNQFSSFGESTCYCDLYCESFQDCCYDYSSACNKNNFDFAKENLLLSWSCVSMGKASYWMKTNCSKSWQNAEVTSRCINAPLKLNSSTYMDFFPVLGVDNITYRNRHCAHCNHQNRFEFWMLNISLSFQPAGVQSIGDLIDFIHEFEVENTVDNAVVPKTNMPRRRCRKPISNCVFNLTFEKVNDCIIGDVALVLSGDELYKNRHCAFCNGKNNLECGVPSYSRETFIVPVTDFYLTINFKHKSQSSGYSVNYACRAKTYDHHLKACVDPNDIVPPIDTPLDKYRIAVWFIWPNSTCNMPNMTDFQKCLTDVEPSNIFDGKFKRVQKGIYMIRFDVQLTLNQSIELLENYSNVEQHNASSYSILKFLRPFTRPFTLRLGSKKVKVIKTSSRRLGCVGLQVFNTSDYTDIGHGKIYVHKTKRNYTRDQYFKGNTSNGVIKVCEKQLPSDCGGFYIEYKRSEFEVRTNLSLYHKLKGELYRFGHYTLHNDTVYICHEVLEEGSNVIRQYLTLIGLCLSIFCLVIVFVTYMTFSQLRTAPGKNMINLTIGLVLFDVIWLVSPRAVQIRSVCLTTAFGIQYFMLLAHVSMAKIAHDTLCMFADPIAHQRRGSAHQIKTFILLWLIPSAFVALCFMLYHFNILDIQYTKTCWLSGRHVFIIVYIPVCLTMAFNILCFTRSILKMRTLEQNGQMLRAQKQEKSSVFIYIKISTLLGLGWASSFVTPLFEEFSYVVVVLTTFQGVYIFVAFICKKNVLLLYRNLVCGKTENPAPLRIETKV